MEREKEATEQPDSKQPGTSGQTATGPLTAAIRGGAKIGVSEAVVQQPTITHNKPVGGQLDDKNAEAKPTADQDKLRTQILEIALRSGNREAIIGAIRIIGEKCGPEMAGILPRLSLVILDTSSSLDVEVFNEGTNALRKLLARFGEETLPYIEKNVLVESCQVKNAVDRVYACTGHLSMLLAVSDDLSKINNLKFLEMLSKILELIAQSDTNLMEGLIRVVENMSTKGNFIVLGILAEISDHTSNNHSIQRRIIQAVAKIEDVDIEPK